jgi:hypothetical protein
LGVGLGHVAGVLVPKNRKRATKRIYIFFLAEAVSYEKSEISKGCNYMDKPSKLRYAQT